MAFELYQKIFLTIHRKPWCDITKLKKLGVCKNRKNQIATKTHILLISNKKNNP